MAGRFELSEDAGRAAAYNVTGSAHAIAADAALDDQTQ